MTNHQEYPTRPLGCWDKLKELRRKLFRQSWEMKANGGLIVAAQQPSYPIIAGLGAFGRRLYGPYFSKAMRDPKLLIQYHEAADRAGFPGGEMCSSMHHYLGEMVLGLTTKNPRNGDYSGVDFVFETNFCHSAAKTAQWASEFLDVPHFILDLPQEGGEKAITYVAAQMAEAIDWMHKTTGKKCQDERLIGAVENWWESGVLWARICKANQAIPAPLYYNMLHALMVPFMLGGHELEVLEFYKELLAEVEDRVREGISALGIERCRLTHEGEPMYYAEDFIPEILQRYGAVLVGGFTSFCGGHWQMDKDGKWDAARSLKEMNVSLVHKEDALNFLARCYIEHTPIYRCQRIYEKIGEYLHRAQDWHCRGVVMHLDIGCRSQAMGNLEAKQVLRKAGIPVLTYEASNGDPRNFSPHQVADQVESFLHMLGLRPVEEFG